MKRAIVAHESIVIVCALVVLVGVAVYIVLAMMYNPPTPLSKQKGICAGRNIDLIDYTRMTTNAEDAASYIGVRFRGSKISPCAVNGVNSNISVVWESCLIGKEDNITIEVDERECNMVDMITPPA